jgi:hypothetical protein
MAWHSTVIRIIRMERSNDAIHCAKRTKMPKIGTFAMRLPRSAPRPSLSPPPVSSPPAAFSLLARSAGDDTPRDHAAGCRCAATPPAPRRPARAGGCPGHAVTAGGRARHCSAPAPPGWKAAPQYSSASDSVASITVLHAPILPDKGQRATLNPPTPPPPPSRSTLLFYVRSYEHYFMFIFYVHKKKMEKLLFVPKEKRIQPSMGF